jgi:hypothetical protein
MILFYSANCSRSKMLLDNINRYDNNKIIKLVPIDELRKQNINIESKISSVPALMILPSKEILFGKDLFDHLLLPGRGILCGGQSTRIDKNITESSKDNIKQLEQVTDGDSIVAFALNSNKLSDSFSTLLEDEKIRDDKNYGWDFISNDKNMSDGISDISIISDDNGKKGKLPSIEEIMKARDNVKI